MNLDLKVDLWVWIWILQKLQIFDTLSSLTEAVKSEVYGFLEVIKVTGRALLFGKKLEKLF